MIKRDSHGLLRRQARYGYTFLIPLFIGLIWFFIIPTFKSLAFSFCEVTIKDGGGYNLTFNGIASYIEVLLKDPEYLPKVFSAVGDMMMQAPLIIIFSFFMASILNQNFRGRTAFRVIMFLPIIIVSAAVSELDAGDWLQWQMSGDFKSSVGGTMTSFSSEFVRVLQEVGLPLKLTDFIQGLVDKVYSVIDLSAIQILILLTGMQSISPSLYEAAKVEGGTAWENFWKITFPMVSPLILTCTIYTIIDSFTTTNNGVMTMIENKAYTDLNFSISAAMAWVYFVLVIAIIGIVAFAISRFVFYYDN